MSGLTHFDAQGNAVMVDVSAKAVTERSATAKGRVVMAPETLAAITGGAIKKGDALAVAQLAGIMAAKRTAELIPLCHPLPLTSVKVALTPDAAGNAVEIERLQRRAWRHQLAGGAESRAIEGRLTQAAADSKYLCHEASPTGQEGQRR